MKEGWEYNKIGKLCKTYSGGTPLKNVKEYYQNGNIPWLRSGEVCKKYISETEMFITQKGLENSSAKYYPIDTVVVAMYGATAAQVGILKIEATSNQAVCGILPNRKFLPEFLYYFFCYRKEFLASQAQGGAQPNISQVKIKNLEVPVPPLSEQQSIVDYLDSAFAKIDAMKANAEKSLNEAKALFQASLKEMLEPKEGWEEKKLGDICSDIRYGTSTPSNENGEYKYLRMNNITNDGFLDVSHYKTISLPEKELEKCLVKRGDIIFNRTNSRELVGKSCVFTEDENMVIAGYLIRIRLKEGFEPQFITYSMNLQRSLGLFQHLIVGAVHQANISANNIQKVIINYPPLSEQQSIVETLDSLKSKVDRLKANYDKISQECDALKQAILRQVFE